MPFKVYVDSRFRQDTGGNSSDSEFTVELSHPIQVKGRVFVDVCLVPNPLYDRQILYERECVDIQSLHYS